MDPIDNAVFCSPCGIMRSFVCPTCAIPLHYECCFCPKCGMPISDNFRVRQPPEPCHNCTAPSYPTDKYCYNCGKSVAAVSSAQPCFVSISKHNTEFNFQFCAFILPVTSFHVSFQAPVLQLDACWDFRRSTKNLGLSKSMCLSSQNDRFGLLLVQEIVSE